MSRRFPIAVGLFACIAATTPLGCGSDDGLGTRYKVSGKVTYKGEPLKKGSINFVPEAADGRAATGEIADGEIKNVSTGGEGDGILPGKYKVAITALEDVDLSKVSAKYAGGAPDGVALSKEARKAKKLIPEKYGNAIDSGLTADITSNGQALTYDLVDK
jgi:hypothetical protein